MDVSVIIVAYNAEKTVQRCLNALEKQSFSNFELIFVNDGSTDKTEELAKAFPRVHLVRNTERLGIAKSRNVGISQAKGKLIFFTDSDCIPLPQWLEAGVAAMRKTEKWRNDTTCENNPASEPDLVTGWTLYENSYPSYQDRVVQGKDAFFTCNLGFKKKALDAVGGFDEQFNMYGEDKDLCFRILKSGGKKIFCEEMMVIHQRSLRTPKDEMRRYAHYYKGKLHSQLRHGQEQDIRFRIIRPDALAALVFPPLLLLTRSFRSFDDVKLLPFTWIGLLRGRLALWKEAVKQRRWYW